MVKASANLPALLIPRGDARERLLSRISAGVDLVRTIERAALGIAGMKYSSDRARLEELTLESKKWSNYNSEMLRRIFNSKEYMTRYDSVIAAFRGGNSLSDRSSSLASLISNRVGNLESIVERLELINEALEQDKPEGTSSSEHNRNVFIVHGHDIAAQQIVARFLERCDIVPIILGDQPDGGDTIIEKFEREASTASYAVVLLTGDDLGASASDSRADNGALRPRARQNVVLELGYFAGFLGRRRVCALKKGDIELPSDYVGVVYTEMDVAGAWKIRLARELRNAGFSVDLNTALD